MIWCRQKVYTSRANVRTGCNILLWIMREFPQVVSLPVAYISTNYCFRVGIVATVWKSLFTHPPQSTESDLTTINNLCPPSLCVNGDIILNLKYSVLFLWLNMPAQCGTLIKVPGYLSDRLGTVQKRALRMRCIVRRWHEGVVV